MSSILTPRSYIEQRQAAMVASTAPSSGVTQITVNPERDTTKEFFGENGPSFRDVLDAINPLNHIPIVSGLLEEATGHKVSIASKLAGGALFGPIGFVASLANVVFEQQTGKDIGGSMVAALSGETPSAVQVASAQKTSHETQQLASIDPTQTSLNAQLAAQTNANNDSENASQDPKSKAVLDLFGGSAPTKVSQAYQKAQFRPYLKESNTQIL